MEKGEQVGRGGTAAVYAWGSDRVVKLFSPRFAHSADVEFEATRAVFAAGVRTPEPIERIQLEGREGIVFERIDGSSLFEAPAPGDTAERLAEIHASIHARTSPALPTRAQRLALAIERFPEHRAELEAREALLPPGSAICHGLFHPGHVLLARSGPVVIDWPDACSGPAAYDVARSAVFMRYLGGLSAAAISHHAALAQRYLEAYLKRGGVTRDAVERCMGLAAFVLLLSAPRHPDRPALERMASPEAT
jgi:hypothetical protein